MNLVFAGTPQFARLALEALLGAGHAIELVLTQPDRPAGRGLQMQSSPVKQAALASGLSVIQPRSLRLDGKYPDDARDAHRLLREAGADVMVVAAYGLLLPQSVLDIPTRGCLNIHASLLPRWRGAAPIQRAIAAGDEQTGITIMQMDAGLDTGPMLLRGAIPIAPDETAARLHDRLAELGARLIVQALANLAAGTLRAQAQPAEGVTYAARITRHDAPLDFRLPARQLARRVRAFDSTATVHNTVLKIIDVAVEEEVGGGVLPGQIIAVDRGGVSVATGDGVLRLLTLQKPGGRRLAAREFVAGFALRCGERFELPADGPSAR